MAKTDIPCIELPTLKPLSITLPGGIFMADVDLMAMIQPALAPLVPVFNILDTVMAVVNAFKTVPEVVLNPKALLDALAELLEKFGKLLGLIPQLSLPLTLVGLLDLLIDALAKAKLELGHLDLQLKGVAEVRLKAELLGDLKLMAIAECAEANIAIEVENVATRLGALAGLIGIINLFMGLVGGKAIPDFSNLAGKPLGEAVELIDGLVKVLEAARKAIPIP